MGGNAKHATATCNGDVQQQRLLNRRIFWVGVVRSFGHR